MPCPPRTGRPRDTQIDAAVLEALDHTGYGALTLAGTHAAPTPPSPRSTAAGRPDNISSSLRSPHGSGGRKHRTRAARYAINECLEVFVAAFDHLPPGITGPLFADCTADQDLSADFMAALFALRAPPSRTASNWPAPAAICAATPTSN